MNIAIVNDGISYTSIYTSVNKKIITKRKTSVPPMCKTLKKNQFPKTIFKK